jgi:2-polyprenyl-3-methyl-5-hydroxy-6-metoxy-1,4-benzoquinol methylase
MLNCAFPETLVQEFIAAIERIPPWFLEKRSWESPAQYLIALAARKIIADRYKEILKQEGEYWGSVAHELLERNEVPRWADHRRYEAQYVSFGKESSIALYHLLFGKQLSRLLSLVKGLPGRILELGCGCGWLSLEISRLGKDIIGIDGSQSEIDLANFFYKHRGVGNESFLAEFYGFRQLRPTKHGTAQYRMDDLNCVSLPPRAYAGVIAWESLHHIQNLEGLCEQVQCTLKEDGQFIVHETIREEISGDLLYSYLTCPLFISFVQAWHGNHKHTKRLFFHEEILKIYKAEFVSHPNTEKLRASPFEGVSGHEMRPLLEKHFRVEKAYFYHGALTEYGAFRALDAWEQALGFPASKQFINLVMGFLKRIDDLMIWLHIAKPRHVFMILRPRAGATLPVPIKLRDRVSQICQSAPDKDAWHKALMQAMSVVGVGSAGVQAALNLFSIKETFQGVFRPAEHFSSYLLVDGWYLEEGDCRWTDGSARTFLHIPLTARTLVCEFMGSPNSSSNSPHKFRVIADGKELCTAEITSPGWHRLQLPVRHDGTELSSVTIESDTFCPKQLGLSDDRRTLGIAVREMVFQ